MSVSETLASFTHLPPEVQKHLEALEEYIGDTDGKSVVTWAPEPENSCVDDGVIDSSEAVTAFNGIVSALTAALSDQAGGWQLVPKEPTEAMWGGLARDLVMWDRGMPNQYGSTLYKHLRSTGRDIPAWLLAEIPDIDHTPPKGTVAACIYKAMIAAASPPSSTAGEGK